MSSTDDVRSFVGLDYKAVKKLMKKSCDYVDELSSSLLAMKSFQPLSDGYCTTYEYLLLERLDMCRKLNEFYVEDRKHSCWLFRLLIDRHIIKVSQLHQETLFQLMLLRNYMALHEQKGEFID